VRNLKSKFFDFRSETKVSDLSFDKMYIQSRKTQCNNGIQGYQQSNRRNIQLANPSVVQPKNENHSFGRAAAITPKIQEPVPQKIYAPVFDEEPAFIYVPTIEPQESYVAKTPEITNGKKSEIKRENAEIKTPEIKKDNNVELIDDFIETGTIIVKKKVQEKIAQKQSFPVVKKIAPLKISDVMRGAADLITVIPMPKENQPLKDAAEPKNNTQAYENGCVTTTCLKSSQTGKSLDTCSTTQTISTCGSTQSLNPRPMVSDLNLPHSEENKKSSNNQPDKLKTHTYDGTLPKKSDLMDAITAAKSVSEPLKREFVFEFLKQLLDKTIPENTDISSQYLITLVDDWGKPNNDSACDGVTADDLLYICSIEWNMLFILEKTDIMDEMAREFFIQCSDMQTGACPQGRVTRFWQIASAYLEWYQ